MHAAIATQVETVRAQLAGLADPQVREGVRWYFQGTVDPYGVRAAAQRKIAAALFRQVRQWPPAMRNRLCAELWNGGKMEDGGVVIYLYERFRGQCGHCEFHLFEKWIDRFVRNWAHCDGVATRLIAAALVNDPGLIRLLPPWTASPNRWKRRAAAVALVREARTGRHTAEILQIAGALLADPDDMVRKGVGWLLKDAYPARPRDVLSFLRPRSGATPRLVLRIAAEKMTASHRAALLGAAR